MIITRNPAQTLELCYVSQKLRPSNIDEPKTDYKPSMGERWAIAWDEDKNKIISVPPQRHDAVETKRSRANTTGRIASRMMQARILAAAENQHEVRANFLRYLYDPECPESIKRAVYVWARARMLLLVPADDARLASKRKMVAGSAIADALLLQFSQMVRGGGERYTETQLCRYLGYASMDEANWAKTWRRLAGTFMLQMQDFEGVAMRPVVRVIDQIFADPVAQAPKPEQAMAPAPEQPPAPKAAAPRHGSTLTFKRGA